ncbi:uncharacterized protein JCM6883_002163 [Sporobolomyces salmoneus]|uniref:uncharacterized protein n=1 Tax=Sporobolomyces salmoneus TaxID=183962 RepID=UPI0031758E35
MAPLPVIIDTDPGVDDVLALLLALSSPHLLVVGITLTHGNCSLSSTEKNLSKLFYALEKHLEYKEDREGRWRGLRDVEWRTQWGGKGCEKIRVWRGCEGPTGGKAVTAKYFHGQDGLANCETLHPELTAPPGHSSPFYTIHDESALEGVTSLVESWPKEARKLSYIALGPMTSLAQLSEKLDLEDSFERILSMGGAVEHPGNTTPIAEFNYYADPWSARTLFSLPLSNLYIFPLDLTTYLILPFSLYASSIDPDFSSSSKSVAKGKDPLIHFTSSFLKGTEKVMKSFGGDAMELHDPIVVFALIEYARHTEQEKDAKAGEFAEGWEWKRVDFEIECDGTLTRGMLVLDHRASSKSSTSLTGRTGQTNRTIAIEQDVEVNGDVVLDVVEAEAREAEKKEIEKGKKRVCGARVVTTSPGSRKMRKELFERVWGVRQEEPEN